MANKAYVGVNNIAKTVKKGYVGVNTAFPIYQTQTTTETVTINSDSLLSKYFTVTNSGYGFAWNTTYSQFRSLNGGKASGTAQVTLTALQDCTVTYTYNYGTEANYDKFTLTVKGSTIHSAVSGVGTAKTRTDTLTKGQTIVFLYTKDGSVDTNGDYVAFYNMSAAVTTTKEVQVGTDYRDVARKIKKAYVGVGGVAKLCYKGTKDFPQYFTTAKLTSARSTSAASASSNAVVFAGGSVRGGGSTLDTVDALDSQLVKSSLTSLNSATHSLSAASTGNYAVFAAGWRGSFSNVVYAYDSDYSKYSPYSLEKAATDVCGASTPNYAVFFGGRVSSTWGDNCSQICKYSTDLTRSISHMTDGISSGMVSASVGNFVLLGGGLTYSASNSDQVRVYDATTITALSNRSFGQRRTGMCTCSTTDYAIFAGGSVEGTSTNNIAAFDSELTLKTDAEPLSVAAGGSLTGGSIQEFGVINLGEYNLLECYDGQLNKQVMTLEDDFKFTNKCSCNVGEYLVFAGGYYSATSTNTDNIEVYTL